VGPAGPGAIGTLVVGAGCAWGGVGPAGPGAIGTLVVGAGCAWGGVGPAGPGAIGTPRRLAESQMYGFGGFRFSAVSVTKDIGLPHFAWGQAPAWLLGGDSPASNRVDLVV